MAESPQNSLLTALILHPRICRCLFGMGLEFVHFTKSGKLFSYPVLGNFLSSKVLVFDYVTPGLALAKQGIDRNLADEEVGSWC